MTENGHVVAYEKLPEGVLRFEVQYKREKLRRVEKDLGLHSSTYDPFRVLWHLMQNSRKLVCKHFSACYSNKQIYAKCCCAEHSSPQSHATSTSYLPPRAQASHS